MNKPELLPCPFCGGEATMIQSEPGWEDRVHFIARCREVNCIGCHINIWEATPERAAAAWNRRADTVAKLAEPYNFSLLCDWYIHSVTGDPVWTEAHIRELLKDFYLIPKGDLP